MTTMISHLFLQQYWWIIISLLAGLLVFLMFVQGGQSMIFSLSNTDLQKTIIVNTMGRKWEFTFTTLVTFGGAFFASFPLFYATSFGGAYWVWTAILFSFIIQAIAFEYRSKPDNLIGKRSYDIFLFVNGSVSPFLIGVAVATFFTGSLFSLNLMNQVQWDTRWYGLEALTNIRNLALGLAVLFLVRVNGLLYILNTVDEEEIIKKSRKKLLPNTVPFLIFFLGFIVSLLFSTGYAADPSTGEISLEKYKYWQNFVDMPFVTFLFMAGTGGILYGIANSVFRDSLKGIWFSGAGTVLVVFSMFLIAGFNGTSFYPSSSDLQSSLTIQKASSSKFTLTVMMYFSFIIPIVFTYIYYAWNAISDRKITGEEMESGGHKY
jgi:cytochrome bd ubiquinol oxidase subunit II